MEEIRDKFGYKNKRSLLKEMMVCGVIQKEGLVTIIPTHHESGDVWNGDGIEDEDKVVISIDLQLAQIGAAIRIAFSRCTG